MENTNQPPIATPPPPQEIPVNKPTRWKMWLLIASVVVASIASVLYFSVLKLPLSKPITHAPAPTSTPVEQTDPTADWKTYTNASFNFTLQYPPELSMQKNASDNLTEFVTSDYAIDTKSGPNAGAMIKGSKITISVWPPTDEGFLERYCNSKNASETMCKVTSIKGYKAAEIVQNKKQRKEVAIQLSKSETVSISAEISDVSNQLFFMTFDQILSTFKFIQQ